MQLRAEKAATVKARRLEDENEELRRQLQVLTADNGRLEARALAAEEQFTLSREENADLRTELQAQLAINESRAHQIDMLIHARDATQASPRKVGVPVSYEKTDYDALVIRDIYDLNKLKNAIGILISDGLWHCKYWFALFRLFSDHKVLTYACSAAVFAQWAEASFPTAGTNIANSMKSFQRYCKAKPSLWSHGLMTDRSSRPIACWPAASWSAFSMDGESSVPTSDPVATTIPQGTSSGYGVPACGILLVVFFGIHDLHSGNLVPHLLA